MKKAIRKVRKIAPTKQESFCMCLFVSQGKVWVEGLFWQTPTRNHAEIAGRCFVWFIPDDLLHFWGPFFFGGGWGVQFQTPLNSKNTGTTNLSVQISYILRLESNNMWFNNVPWVTTTRILFHQTNVCLISSCFERSLLLETTIRGPEALSHTYKQQKHLEDGCLHCGCLAPDWRMALIRPFETGTTPMIWGLIIIKYLLAT